MCSVRCMLSVFIFGCVYVWGGRVCYMLYASPTFSCCCRILPISCERVREMMMVGKRAKSFSLKLIDIIFLHSYCRQLIRFVTLNAYRENAWKTFSIEGSETRSIAVLQKAISEAFPNDDTQNNTKPNEQQHRAGRKRAGSCPTNPF